MLKLREYQSKKFRSIFLFFALIEGGPQPIVGGWGGIKPRVLSNKDEYTWDILMKRSFSGSVFMKNCLEIWSRYCIPA
jgi:hypothetical protein